MHNLHKLSYCKFAAALPPNNPHRIYHDQYYGRAAKSDNELFPKTVLDSNKQNFNEGNYNELQLLTVNEDVCYYTKLICSHEIPKNIRVIKIGNYYILME